MSGWVTSRNVPPTMPDAEISSTPPSQKMPSLNSRSYLFLKLRTGLVELITKLGVSTRLSATTSGSSMNKLLGGELGLAVDVVHNGAGPWGLVAVQPAGKAGAVTPSKFCPKTRQGGVGVGVGVGVPGVGVGDGVGVGPLVITKLLLDMSKNTLPTASIFMRAVEDGVPGMVTVSLPSLAVEADKTVGNVFPPST